MSLACPRRRPQPGSWPGRLPRAPRPSPDTRSWPLVSAPSALAGARGPPCGARPGAPTAPAHPSSPPGLNPGPLPAAPPGPHSSLPAACKAPERYPTWDGTPTKMPGPRGVPWREDVLADMGVGPGAPLLGPTVATSFRSPAPPVINFPRLVSGVSVGGGTSKFPLLTLGQSPSQHPASRPLGLLAAPPTQGVVGCQGGNGGGRRNSGSPAHPPPGCALDGGLPQPLPA